MEILKTSQTFIAALASVCFAAAAVPTAINYQGRLTNESGVPQPGSRAMSIKIFDASNAGATLYSENVGNINIDSNGVYRFQFNSSGIMNALANSSEQWLELSVGDIPQTPRQRLLAVPFAVVAGALPDGAVTSGMIANGAVDVTKISGLGSAATLNATEFGTAAQGSVASAAWVHPNAKAALLLLREQLDSETSADIVIVGDSTGDGSDRWPRKLAEKLAVAYPKHEVAIHNVSQNSAKTWTPVVIQASPNGADRAEWWKPLSGIPAWSAGTYAAGAFVTYLGSTWFSQVAGNSDIPTGDSSKWVISSTIAQVVASGEDAPWLDGDGTATTQTPFEVEIDFVMPANPSEQILWQKGLLSPQDSTKGFLRLYMWGKTFQLHWANAVGGVLGYSGYTSTPIPVAEGTRVRVRCSLVPNNGSNRILTFSYSTWNGSVWSNYTTHQTMTQPVTQWVKCPGPIQIIGWDTLKAYELTVRRSAGGTVDFNMPIDNYYGFGLKSQHLTGSPRLNIWNYAWSGQELEAFVGDQPLTGSTFANYDTDFAPRNTCAFFLNCGHNANAISLGKQEAVKVERLATLIKARFPRAAFIAMSQNPGTDARANGLPGQFLNYSGLEGPKRMRAAHVQQSALRNGWGFVDINRVFRDTGNPGSLSTDGLHPNAAGSNLWAETIFQLITR